MADQFDIDDLVRQLRELISVMRGMGSTGGSGGAATGANRDMDRLLRAIAAMAVSMDKGAKASSKAIDEFVKGIDKAIDAQEQTVKAQQRAQAEVDQAAKIAARQAYEASEESRRKSMSAAELAREAADAERAAREAHVEKMQAGYKAEYAKLQDDLYNKTNYAKRLANLQDEEAKSKLTFAGRIDEMARNYGKGGGDMVAFYEAINNAKKLLDTFSPLGKGIADMGKALYEGKQGASANNSALEGFGDTVEKATAFLGPFGMIVGKIVKWFTGYVVEANKLSDRLYKSYQDLSKVGVAASDGMMGLAEASQRLGLGLDESGIQNFVKILTAASEDIAMMSGSAIQGRKNFVELSSSIVRGDVGRQLMNMGMSVEAINEGVAGFIKQQVATGRAQGKTNQELAAGAAAYLKEMDALTKLTGIQKQELENQMEANRQNERFAAHLEELRAQGRDKEADNLEQNMAVISKRFPQLAGGLKDIASGFVTSEAARKAQLAGFAGIPEMMQKGLGSGFKEMGEISKQTASSMRGLAQTGNFESVFGSYYEMLKARGMSEEDALKEIEKIRADRKRQEEGAGDAATAAQTNMRRQQMDSRDSLQDFVKAGVAPATKAMEGFAGVTSKVVTALGGTVAGGMGGGGGGGLAAGGGTTTGGGMSTAGAGGGGVFGAIGRGLSRLAAGGIGGPVDPDKVIKFMGNTGSKEHFDKLDPAVRDAFLQMAVEYNNLTGDKLQINSAFRTPGEQAAIDPGANPKAAPGMSLHNVGRAIDIQPNQKNYLMGAGLLDRYGFKTLPNDPPHIFMQTGGVATGPRSGYSAMLHGTEAVVPLPDGKTIPVEMPNLDRNMEQQVSMMSAQLVALEELVRYMRDNTAISAKILQAANN